MTSKVVPMTERAAQPVDPILLHATDAHIGGAGEACRVHTIGLSNPALRPDPPRLRRLRDMAHRLEIGFAP